MLCDLLLKQVDDQMEIFFRYNFCFYNMIWNNLVFKKYIRCNWLRKDY